MIEINTLFEQTPIYVPVNTVSKMFGYSVKEVDEIAVNKKASEVAEEIQDLVNQKLKDF